MIIASNIQKDSSPTIVECRPQERRISCETKEKYLEFLHHGKLDDSNTLSHLPRLRSVLEKYVETEADKEKKQAKKQKPAEKPTRKSERLVIPSTSKKLTAPESTKTQKPNVTKRTTNSPTSSDKEVENDNECNNLTQEAKRKKLSKKASEPTSKKRKSESFKDSHKINYQFKVSQIETDGSDSDNLVIAENQKSAETQSSLPEINNTVPMSNQPTTSTTVPVSPERPPTGVNNEIQTEEIQALEKIKKKEKDHRMDASQPTRRGEYRF